MSMSVTESPADNVPAWKRLGLKLRGDVDAATLNTSTVATEPYSDNHVDSIGKRSRGFESDEKLEKRRKTGTRPLSENTDTPSRSRTSDLTTLKAVSGDYVARGLVHETPKSISNTPKHIVFDDSNTPKEIDATAPSTDQYVHPRRKSVTFTPDTKTEDGFSAHNLFKAWSAQHNNDSNIDPVLNVEVPASSTPSKNERKSKTRTKAKKDPAKPKDLSGVQTFKTDSNDTPSYIQYLTDFHHDHSNWKFNKNKQTDLLKHLFDPAKLPSALDPAIISYIHGLRGASARERIQEQATTILSDLASNPLNLPEDDDDNASHNMETPEGRRAAYDAALQRQISRYEASGAGRSQWAETQLETIRLETERGVRADKVLAELLRDSSELNRKDRGGFSSSRQAPGSSSSSASSASLSSSQGFNSVGERAAKAVEELKKTKKRSRKSRTEVEEVSSSSESEVSSGEGGEEPIFDKELLDRKFGKKRKQ